MLFKGQQYYIWSLVYSFQTSIYLISYKSYTRLGLDNSKGNRQNYCLHGIYWGVSVWMSAHAYPHAVCIKNSSDLRRDFPALNHSNLLLCTNVSEF